MTLRTQLHNSKTHAKGNDPNCPVCKATVAPLTQEQRANIIELLWSSMKRDPEYRDHVQTGWGTKTQDGLIACVDRIIRGEGPIPADIGLGLRGNRLRCSACDHLIQDHAGDPDGGSPCTTDDCDCVEFKIAEVTV